VADPDQGIAGQAGLAGQADFRGKSGFPRQACLMRGARTGVVESFQKCDPAKPAPGVPSAAIENLDALPDEEVQEGDGSVDGQFMLFPVFDSECGHVGSFLDRTANAVYSIWKTRYTLSGVVRQSI